MIDQNKLDALLLQASRRGKSLEVLELLRAGADPNCRDSIEKTPLSLAVGVGSYKTCALLATYANPNLFDITGVTPIMYSCAYDLVDIFALFLPISNFELLTKYGLTARKYFNDCACPKIKSYLKSIEKAKSEKSILDDETSLNIALIKINNKFQL